MPCNSDYLEPNIREKELQRTAKLLVFFQQEIGENPEGWLLEEAENIYCQTSRIVPILCGKLKWWKANRPDVFERIVYGRDRNSRDLANWYEDHERADREREAHEAADRQKELLKEKAWLKLSPEERKAWGLKYE